MIRSIAFTCREPYRGMRKLLDRTTLYRYLSSDAGGTSSKIKLRSLAKPFFLRCHPDVHSSDAAKEVNLKAIQNLNSYLDTAQALVDHKHISNLESPVSIEFIINIKDPPGRKKRKKEIGTRRKVDMTLPLHVANVPDRADYIKRYTASEVVKLLKVAGLPPPDNVPSLEYSEQTFGMEQSVYEKSKAAFTSKVNWQKVDQLYKEAVRDMEADIKTQNLVKNSRKMRRAIIGKMLSNIRLKEEMSEIEQFVALRRMSLILDDNFEALHLEDAGAMWEKTFFVFTPARGINVSGSAINKRRLKEGDNGFSFTLHHDNSVTMEIPCDFTDTELINELDRNLWDFYDIIGDGLDQIFEES